MDLVKLKGVKVKSPIHPSEILDALISKKLIKTRAGNGQKNKIFELHYYIERVLPRINCIDYHEDGSRVTPKNGLENPLFIYRGLERLYNSSGEGEKIYIYVLRPYPYTYEYIPHMVCRAKRVSSPKSAVFVVYLKISNGGAIILDWEWVKSNDGIKPDNSSDRYQEEVVQ